MRARLSFACVLAAALLSAACGARLDDEQLATAQGGAGTGAVPGAQAGRGATGATATTVAGGTPAAPGATVPGGAPAGTPAEPGAPAEGGEACAPEPVDEVGVSDGAVTIGNVSTISGPIAGFGQSGLNAVRAYVAYVNANGGVCGRELELATGDDRLDAGTNRSETQRLSNEVFAFVGEVTVVDDGGASVLDGTNIARVSLSIGSAAARLPNNFSPNPLNPDQPGNASTPIMRHFAAQGVTSAAIVWPAQADARARGQGYQHDLQQAGITQIDTYEVAITETNYVNVAQRIENAGSQLVLTTLEVSGMARLAQAFAQVGYKPQVPFYGAQAYGQQFLDLAGPAADGTTLGLTFATFDDAGSVPMMRDFLDWYGRVAPGGPEPDFFAINSWAAADMFVRALRAAGGAPTRDAVLEQLRGMTEYTGDGFMAPRNPAGKQMGDCFVIVRAEGGDWSRVEPAGGGFVNC